MQPLLHPGCDWGHLPVLTGATATMAIKKATPVQECERVCAPALQSGCVTSRFEPLDIGQTLRPKFATCYFPKGFRIIRLRDPAAEE